MDGTIGGDQPDELFADRGLSHGRGWIRIVSANPVEQARDPHLEQSRDSRQFVRADAIFPVLERLKRVEFDTGALCKPALGHSQHPPAMPHIPADMNKNIIVDLPTHAMHTVPAFRHALAHDTEAELQG
jgi:hypothetical protein